MDILGLLLIFGLIAGTPFYIKYQRLKNDPRPAGETPLDVVHSQEPLLLLRHYFKDWLSALNFYGRSMEQIFPTKSHPTCCLLCGTQYPTEQWVCLWTGFNGFRLSYPLLNMLWLVEGQFHPKIEQQLIPFLTTHSFCLSCARRAKWQRAVAFCVEVMSDLVLVGSVFLMLFPICASLGNAPRKSECMIFFIISVGGFLLGVLGRQWAFGLQVPKPMRFIRRWPFYLYKAKTLKEWLACAREKGIAEFN